MKGHVDDQGRALIAVDLLPDAASEQQSIEVWIDTGFNGDIVAPQHLIEQLSLPHVGTVQATLADGKAVRMRTYPCWIEWFGETSYLEVVANEGEYPLMGFGLLLGRDLRISYRTNSVSID